MARVAFIPELYSQGFYRHLQTAMLEACQVPNVGKIFPRWVNVKGAPASPVRNYLWGRNRLFSRNCHMLFLTGLFDSWAYFHKHTDPQNKMNIITNLKKADKVKQCNNVWQNYIINANLCDVLPFVPLDFLQGTSFSKAMLNHTIPILYHYKTPL